MKEIIFAHTLVLFAGLLFLNQSYANGISELSQSYIEKAADQKLYGKDQWRRLLQYPANPIFKNESEVKSKRFFYSPEGAQSLEDELYASIEEIFKSLDYDDLNQSPRCKKLARYHWLNNHLNFPEAIKNIYCEQFSNWVDLENINSVSLVFATGYLKNPASFYGHPFLKFNTEKDGRSSLLDTTLNNGAIVPNNENALVYVIKGLLGGYQSAFSDTKFYQLNHNYTEQDLRDTWEYELNLTQAQIENIVHYSWELLGEKFGYKFFNKNCAFFIENILAYGLQQRITKPSIFYQIPATTFFNIMDMSNGTSPLVKKITHNPSRQTQFHQKYTSLSRNEKASVEQLISDDASHIATMKLSEDSQIKVIDTTIDYYNYLQVKDSENIDTYTRKKYQLYLSRLELDKKIDSDWQKNSTDINTAPHEGTEPTLTSTSILYNDVTDYGVRLRFRPASYDEIGIDEGHVPHSTLNMFNLEIDIIDNDVNLSKLEFINISTLGLSETGLKKDANLTWSMRFGLDRPTFDCSHNCTIPFIEGRIGKAIKLGSRFAGYINYTGLAHSTYRDAQFRHGLRIGLIGNIFPQWKTSFWYEGAEYIDTSDSVDYFFKWENRFGNNKKVQYRLSVEKREVIEASFGINYFW